MKRLLIILIGLFWLMNGKGQTIVNRASQANTVSDARLQGQYNFYLPRYADTATANQTSPFNNRGIDSCGALIYVRATNSIWYRQCSPHKWIEIAGSGNSTIINIYNNSIVNIIYSNGDSCLILVNGNGIHVDTVCANFKICSFFILNSSQIQVCSCPDSTVSPPTTTCDTLDFTGGSLYIFQQWVQQRAAGIVEGGGILGTDIGYDANYSTSRWYTRKIQGYGYQWLQYGDWGNGGGIAAWQASANTTAQFTLNYASSPWRVSAFVPSPIQPYKGYYQTVNGYYGIGQATGLLQIQDNTAKIPFIIWHDKDTANTVALSFGGIFPTYSGTVASATIPNSLAMEILTTKQMKFNGYGSGTFTGTQTRPLTVTSTGQIIESPINLASSNFVTGNLPIGNIVTATNRDASHFLRGDGTWAIVSSSTPNLQQVTNVGSVTNNPIEIQNGSSGDAIVLSNTASGGNGGRVSVYNPDSPTSIFYTGIDMLFTGTNNNTIDLQFPNAPASNKIITYPDFAGTIALTNFIGAYRSTPIDLTILSTDYAVEVTVTGKTITLPTAVGITGKVYTIKVTAIGSSTVATTSSQTIDGSTTYSLSAQYKYVSVMSNGANWIIIANN